MVELIGGIFVLLLGALGVLFKQRNNARKKADTAERKAEQVTAVREKERDIDQARAEARNESQEVQREADERPTTDRPTGSFRR
jgi:hypothetical protein